MSKKPTNADDATVTQDAPEQEAPQQEIPQQGTDVLALSVQQLELFAQGQAESEARASSASQLLSTRNGRLSLKGQPIVGDKIDAIILCAPIERLYYDGAFDATALVPPACSSMGIDAKVMRPSGDSLLPQSQYCSNCPKDQWGSAGGGRKGKACRETRRITFLDAENVKSAADVRMADVYAVRPPVTSISAFSDYVKGLVRDLRVPTFAVVTSISLVPDAKTQFKMVFNTVERITDMATISALMDRAREEQTNLLASIAPPLLEGTIVANQALPAPGEEDVAF